MRGFEDVVTLTDGGACRAMISPQGARLVQLWVPGRDGTLADIVLGHDSAAEYHPPASTYIGATCGRYANRIAGGRFTLDGQAVQVDCNEGANHLHGGSVGFDRRLWRLVAQDAASVTLGFHSADGEMGFPGAVDVAVRYAFAGPGRLDITMSGTVAGRATVLNMVNHSYFNMAGQGSGPVDGQLLQIEAEGYLPVDVALLPVGAPQPVAGTPFDFRQLRPLGAAVPPGGFDHNWCLGSGDAPQITALDPASGRGMRLWTNQPGVQLYTAGHLSDRIMGKAGLLLCARAGFALETQAWPDSPNHPDYSTATLRPGETYDHRMQFMFFVR